MLARNDRTEMMGTGHATLPYPRRRIARATLIALLAAALLTCTAAVAAGLTFSKLPGEMTVARWYPSADLLPTGKVLIAGGAAEGARLSSAELFDPASGKFEALAAPMSTNREEPGSVLLPSGKVLITGGYGLKEGKETYLDTAELFDPATSSFEALPAKMSDPRVGPAVALLPSGKVLIAGGADTSTWPPSAEIFDPASGKFEALAGKMVAGEYSGSAATLPSGNVLLAGGYNGTGSSLGTAEMFDPITATFSALGAGHLPVEPRNEAAHVTLANGNVLILGGENQHTIKESLSSIERFNWESSTFEVAGELTQPRVGAGAVVLADGRVVLAGGYDGELKGNRYFKTAEVSAVTPATIATGSASAVTASSATLSATATSEAAVTTYFQYGTSATYGAATTKQAVTASTHAVAFNASAVALTPGTTYHFRAVGENAGGPVYGADQTFTTAPGAPVILTPTLSSVSQTHSRWREGNKLAKLSRRAALGTTFSFTLDQAASVSLSFTQPATGRRVKGRCVAKSHSNRHKPRCHRTVTRGTLTLAAHAGVNQVSFQGRVSASRRLRPGSYTVVITATNTAKQRSAAKRLSFTIVG